MVFVSSNRYSEDKVKKFPLLRGKVDTLHVGDLQTTDTLRILTKFFDGKTKKGKQRKYFAYFFLNFSFFV